VTLVGYHRLLHWSTQTDTYFGREIADRVQVIACLTTLPNIVHSDSHTDMLGTAEWRAVRKVVGASEDDTLVLVWGSERDTETGAKEIAIRAREATVGIPSETRQALADGTNGFERILPGPNRMYPDTDLPPKQVTPERLENIRSHLPIYFWELEDWYRKIGVPEDCVGPLAISPFAELFGRAVREWKLSSVLAAIVLIQYPKRLKHKGLPIEKLTSGMMESILAAYRDGVLAREGILEVMAATLNKGEFSPDLLPEMADDPMAEEFAEDACKETMKLELTGYGVRHRVAMRLAMATLRGKYPGDKVAAKVDAGLQGLN
jgi:Glu-tRNA(Gln) amidotransferase subunit E-like FAD-binding protein